MNGRPRAIAGRPDEAEVLRRRAEQLARRVAAAEAGGGGPEALAFEIAGQACLLPLASLRQVRRLGELLPLPLATEALLGLVHLRGRMLPVVDVRGLLGIDAGPRWQPTHVLVLGQDVPALGIAVSGVRGLQPLAALQAERRSQPLEGMRPDLVRGVGPRGELLLDGERLQTLLQAAPA